MFYSDFVLLVPSTSLNSHFLKMYSAAYLKMAAATGVQDIWQPKLDHIVERTTHMFNNPYMSDVCFIFKNSKGIPIKVYGHKFVLGMSSPIFYKMFYSDQFSGSMEKANEIQMTEEKYGFDSMAFLNFVKFLYTDNIPWTELSVENMIGILKCSDYYDVPRLKAEAGKGLLSKLNTANVILVLDTALLFRHKDLEDKSMEIIDKSAQTVFQSEGILEAKMETLFEIIKRTTLVIDESQVLDICLKWSVKECERKGLVPNVENKRQVLDKIFFEIRFPILPPLKIAELVRSNFLTQKESLDMLLYIHCKGDLVTGENKGLIPEIPFKTELRTQKQITWTCSSCGSVYYGHKTSCLCDDW